MYVSKIHFSAHICITEYSVCLSECVCCVYLLAPCCTYCLSYPRGPCWSCLTSIVGQLTVIRKKTQVGSVSHVLSSPRSDHKLVKSLSLCLSYGWLTWVSNYIESSYLKLSLFKGGKTIISLYMFLFL